ncbi:YbhB/YbcL family Raf kinase inhibitor-like protein [Mycobacterium sp. DL592]|uniref:YbhB/YbcL family Raf kinase inhibitor-like protein n=1 Tax=Mycobacterium sp. DL592 TaxID=2675524 RepID=UPI001FBA8079|nr:YbhB/YbcL family Raf kinase inhibitor-like protein [Mycobacterium sp. DL592]
MSPALSWCGVPQHAATLVLVIEDEDVPLPRPLMHTVAILTAGVDHLDEGALAPGTPGIRFFRTALGRGYFGPRPIPGHGTHHYRFHLFALSTAVPDDVRTARELLHVMSGSVIARGVLTGTYCRPHPAFGCPES